MRSDTPWQELYSWLQYRDAWYALTWWCPCPCPLWFWGTFLPGLVLLGTMYRKGTERAFVALYDHKPVVIVEVEHGRPGWDLLVVLCDSAEQAEQTALELNDAVAAAQEGLDVRQNRDAAAALAERDRCEWELRHGRKCGSGQQEQDANAAGADAGGAEIAPAGPGGASSSGGGPNAASSSRSTPFAAHARHHAIPIDETPGDTDSSNQEGHAGGDEGTGYGSATSQPGEHQHAAVVVDGEGRELHEALHSNRQQQQQQRARSGERSGSGHVVVVDEQGVPLHEVADEPQGLAGDIEEGGQAR